MYKQFSKVILLMFGDNYPGEICPGDFCSGYICHGDVNDGDNCPGYNCVGGNFSKDISGCWLQKLYFVVTLLNFSAA